MKKDRTDRVLDWVIGILSGLIILGLIVVVTTSAHAGIGDETVALYRTWPENIQTGYVSGVMGTLSKIGEMGCANPPTVGVIMAWLRSDTVKPTHTIPEAVLYILVDKHGCKTDPTPMTVPGRKGA